MNSGQFAVYLIFLDHKSNYFERLLHMLLRKACYFLRKKITSDQRKVVIIIFSSALGEKCSSGNKHLLLVPSGFWFCCLFFLGVGEVFHVWIFYVLVTHFGDK